MKNPQDDEYLEADIGFAGPRYGADVPRGFHRIHLGLYCITEGPFHEGAFLISTTPELPSSIGFREFGDVFAKT